MKKIIFAKIFEDVIFFSRNLNKILSNVCIKFLFILCSSVINWPTTWGFSIVNGLVWELTRSLYHLHQLPQILYILQYLNLCIVVDFHYIITSKYSTGYRDWMKLLVQQEGANQGKQREMFEWNIFYMWSVL
jgi:hypothetical protein